MLSMPSAESQNPSKLFPNPPYKDTDNPQNSAVYRLPHYRKCGSVTLQISPFVGTNDPGESRKITD